MEPAKILEYYEQRLDAMLGSIREIVEIESPSRDAARSRKVADWIEERALETGVNMSVERLPVEDGEHIIIRTFPAEKPQTLVLGHTDTVHPVGAASQNTTRIEGDRFYGCGTFDMKANIVLVLEALRYFGETGSAPSTPVTVLLTCDEEIGSHSGRPVVEREAAISNRCLVVEPSAEGRVKTGRKGTVTFTLRVHGTPAHAGLEPEKGVNAIGELAHQIAPIHGLARPEIGTTVNVCTIKGGTVTNVIPALAECEIDVRFSSMAEADRINAAIRAIAPFDARVTLEILGGINRPPLERTDQVASLFARARGLAASYDYGLEETQVGGASDGNFVGAIGVPVLDGLGLAGSGAHTLQEYILISDVAKRATLITLLMM